LKIRGENGIIYFNMKQKVHEKMIKIRKRLALFNKNYLTKEVIM